MKKEYLNAKDKLNRIIISVINYEDNINLIQVLPHRRLFDMAAVPVILKHEGRITSYEYIDYSFLEEAEVTEDYLLDFAIKNTKNIMGIRIESLEYFLYKLNPLLYKEYFNEDSDESEISPLYILSNDSCFLGAGVIMYSGIMKYIYELFNSEFYLLPSSIHEILICPFIDIMDAGDIRSMISNVNNNVLEEGAVLSYNLYKYDKVSESIIIA